MKKCLLMATCLFLYSLTNAQDIFFEWAKGMGSSTSDRGKSITVDASGNVYSVGYYNGTVDFDPGPGVYNLNFSGLYDVYISKLDNEGNFVWAKQLGGTALEAGFSIALDASGNIYTTGYFNGTADFDPGAGTFNLTSAGSSDVFISKLDNAGDFVWAKQLGGTASEGGLSIVLDASGNIYTTGYFNGTADLDPGAGTFDLTSAGSNDVFISKLDNAGDFVWAKQLGGTGSEQATSISTDASGNVFTTGYFEETLDMDPGAGTYNLSSAGSEDIFVCKLDNAGNLMWANKTGGSDTDYASSITIDPSGNVLTTGYFNGTVDFDPGTGINNLSSFGESDAYIFKLDNDGNLIWAKQIGSADSEYSISIVTDASGNVYTTGYFEKTGDFDPGAGTFNLTSAGGDDIYISMLDNLGNFIWAKGIGGNLDDAGNSIAVDASENVYITGYFWNAADMDPGNAVFNLTSAGSVDVFVEKLSPVPTGVIKSSIVNDFTIYPNPASSFDEVTIDSFVFPIKSLELYTIQGCLVKSTQSNSLKLSGVCEGLYLLRVISENNIVNTTLFVK